MNYFHDYFACPAESGGASYLNSYIGRWLTPDPLADKYPGWSPYNYCMNNSLRYIDIDGLDVWVVSVELRGVLRWITVAGNVGIAFYDRGGLGLFYGGSIGVASGEGSIGGVNVGWFPSANSHKDFRGWAVNLGSFSKL